MAGSVVVLALIVWLTAVAAIVFYRMLSGEIHCDGLLRRAPNEPLDPERIVMLIGTVAAAAYYAATALSTMDGVSVGKLPDVPDLTLELLGGSQLFYLAGKIARTINQ